MERSCQAYVVDRLRLARQYLDEAVGLAMRDQETALRGALRDAAHQVYLAREGCTREGGFGGELL